MTISGIRARFTLRLESCRGIFLIVMVDVNMNEIQRDCVSRRIYWHTNDIFAIEFFGTNGKEFGLGG